VHRLAQRAAANAVALGEFRLGNLAARRNLPFDNGGLNAFKNLLGTGLFCPADGGSNGLNPLFAR